MRYFQDAAADSTESIGLLIDFGESGPGGGFPNFSDNFKSGGMMPAKVS